MSFVFAVMLLSGAPARSILEKMPENQLCAAMKRGVTRYAGASSAAARTSAAKANCAAKRLEIDITILVSGDRRQLFIDTFMMSARAGACNFSDPTMAAFAKRGWHFQYTFHSAAAEPKTFLLEC